MTGKKPTIVGRGNAYVTCPVCLTDLVAPIYIGNVMVTEAGLIIKPEDTVVGSDSEGNGKFSRFELFKITLAKEALVESEGKISRAAKYAGVAPRTIYNWVAKFNLYSLAADYKPVVSIKELCERT